MLSGWLGNPYITTEDQKPKAPDVMGALGKLRWQSELEAYMHYISTRLGMIEGKEYKFLLDGAPSDWPEWYLDSVLSHDTSVKILRAKQKYESKETNRKIEMENTNRKLAQTFDPTGEKGKKQLESSRKLMEWFKSQSV